MKSETATTEFSSPPLGVSKGGEKGGGRNSSLEMTSILPARLILLGRELSQRRND